MAAAPSRRHLVGMQRLDGHWKVRRESGFLPPFGIRKFISGDHGWTLLGLLPVGPFKVENGRLRYRLWPLEDELIQLDDGTWLGRGYVFGKQFCRFRLERKQEQRSLLGRIARRPSHATH